MDAVSNRKRVPDLPALTGIRCVAASLVFLFHVTDIPGMNWLASFSLFQLGGFGVAVFFVLSGFILAYNYAGIFESGVKAADYGHFIWDRLCKIYPLYFFTLVLCIPIQIAGHHRDWSWTALGLQLTLTQCMFPIQNLKWTDYFNVPGWSVSCEMLFYLFAPIIIWLLFRTKQWLHIILLLAVVWPVSLFAIGGCAGEFIWPARFAPLRAPEFIVGVATAVCFIRRQSHLRKSWLFIAIGIVLISVAVVCDSRVPLYLQQGPLAAPGAALLIYGLARDRGIAARLLSDRLLTLLGMSSYAFYLIHDPVIRICKGLLQHYQWSITGTWASMVFGAALFTLTQLLSIYLFKKVELPLQRSLRKLIRKKYSTAPVSQNGESQTSTNTADG